MKRFLYSLVLVLSCAATQFFSQTVSPNVSLQTNQSEPFKIEQGISFAASVPGDRRAVRADSDRALYTDSSITADFRQALEIVKKNYVGGKKIDYNELTKSSLTAMLRALDPHSNYHDAKDFQEFLSDEQSEYIGIGASIINYTENGELQTFITSTFPESPASRAGLRFGDKILAVNNEKMTGRDSLYVREKIRGVKGTVARLTIEKAVSHKIEIVEVRRNSVPQPSIPDAYMLRPGIGYIELSNGFNYTTNDEIETALKDLREQGMQSLILDLRDNGGGILAQSVKVAEKFLPAGQTIVSQRGKFEIDNRTWKSANKNPLNVSLVVLANGNSASASEIVIGALQDYDRAIVVGEKTFGKGLVQSIINLPYNSGLTITTARYYTPSGRSIQREYRNENLYDYFRQKASASSSSSSRNLPASKTVTGRNVFGGDGITPDEIVTAPVLTAQQLQLLDPVFLFSRELIYGRVKNFEQYNLTRPVQYGRRIQSADVSVGENLLSAFKNFLSKNLPALTDADFARNKKFVLERLRYNLAIAAFGTVAANQVLIENDVQVARAVEALPRAQNLALSARKLRAQN